jgi:succinate dehydrogenase / fumarate reductase, cytochrome b subunit
MEPAKEALPLTPRRVSKAERPLSPHLSVYRWQITNTLSILHRFTGVVLTLGFLVLALWLISAAMGSEAYHFVQKLILSPIGTLIMVGFTLSFYYHLMNGIRHLLWDIGVGFELKTVTTSGMLVVVGTAALTIITWWNYISQYIG